MSWLKRSAIGLNILVMVLIVVGSIQASAASASAQYLPALLAAFFCGFNIFAIVRR